MESKLKLIQTEEAVGHVLCHDMTQIIPGVMKDARFRKGHVQKQIFRCCFPWEKSICMSGRNQKACCTKTRRQRAFFLFA